MTISDQERIALLEHRIEQLEKLLIKEVARLDDYNKGGDEAFERYIMDHQREHGELSKMIYPAYFATHPEALNTIIEADKILGKPKDDGSDPQP